MATLLTEALKSGPIRAFVLGSSLSQVGTWIQRVTMGFLAFEATHSVAWVGAIAACEVIPNLLVAPFTGVAIDRMNRLKLFIWGQSLAQVQAYILAAMAFADLLPVAALAAGAVGLGIIDAINQPLRLTLIGDVASKRLVGSSVALNALGFNTARFVGPVVAGLAIASGGAGLAFLLNGISFLPLFIVLLGMRRRAAAPLASLAPPAGDGLLGGFRHVIHHTVLGPTFILLISSAFLVRPLFELLPAVSGLWFDGSPEQLAWLVSSIGIGAMASSVWMLRRGSIVSVFTASITMPAVMIAAAFAFAASEAYWLTAYPLLVIAGFAAVACAVGMQSVIHFAVHPAYLGRALSIYGSVQRGLPATGALIIGVAADYVGLRTALLAPAALAAVIWLFIWRKRHQLRAELIALESAPKE